MKSPSMLRVVKAQGKVKLEKKRYCEPARESSQASGRSFKAHLIKSWQTGSQMLKL